MALRSCLLVILMAVGSVSPSHASQPACGAGMTNATLVEGNSYTLAYRTAPAVIVLGRHFALELVLCPKDGRTVPQSVRIDAFMPEHNHGMNYKPTIKSIGSGRFRADGLMLHMPGRWELRVEAVGADGSERIHHDLQLK